MMMRITLAALAAAVSIPFASLAFAQGAALPETAIPGAITPADSGYVSVGDLKMYYEIYGSGGTPLVLLHGAFGTIEMWGPVLSGLAEGRQVIAVETQGHGHTADIDRPITNELMADDVAALIAQLNLGQVDLMGYSMGGATALQVAIRHPELVRKLVAVSASMNRDSNYEVVWQGLGALTMDIFEGTPFYDSYRRGAPDPDAFPQLLEKMNQHDLDFAGWPTEAIQAITVPTLLAFGDSDIVRIDEMVEMFELLGGGVPGDFVGMPNVQLAILPGAGHLGVVMQQGGWLTEMAVAFLDAPPSASLPPAL